jgi:hypothetical protein
MKVEFQVGDMVEVITNTFEGKHPRAVAKGTRLKVVKELPPEDDGWWISKNGVKPYNMNVNRHDFKLVSTGTQLLDVEVGDTLKCVCVDHSNWYKVGDEEVVRTKLYAKAPHSYCVNVESNPSNSVWVDLKHFRVIKKKADEMADPVNVVNITVNPSDNTHPDKGFSEEIGKFIADKYKAVLSKDAGMFRPVLEERKVGKVSIELFDTGFPNAVWEISKLMSWAAENKGYKPNDWKSLPNAEVSLPAAASRHRIKPLLGEKYDDESKLLHKAHEAFNVLAELELMLTGVIK